MEPWLLILVGGLTGTVGALLGIGGGVMLVPLLVLGLGCPIEEAVPASLLCVVASSCGAAASYLDQHLSDLRLALVLELATVTGAILGGLVAGALPPAVVAMTFGLFALVVALQLTLGKEPLEAALAQGGAPGQAEAAGPDSDATGHATVGRHGVKNLPLGISGSFVAGGLSALLGVGGGPLKVPLMNLGMGIPFKVASATSNLMIGVTGAASVAAYAWRGHLNVGLASPLVVGVLGGAWVGSRLMVRTPARYLRTLFAAVLGLVAIQMLWKGGAGLWAIR